MPSPDLLVCVIRDVPRLRLQVPPAVNNQKAKEEKIQAPSAIVDCPQVALMQVFGPLGELAITLELEPAVVAEGLLHVSKRPGR